MKLRDRLTLLFTAASLLLLVAFAVAIYVGYARNRSEEFYKRLRLQAETKADLLLDARVQPEVLQLIYKNARNTLYQEEVAIYGEDLGLLYHDAVDIDIVKEDEAMLRRILAEGEIRFVQEGWQVVGFRLMHAERPYAITAAALDVVGLERQSELRQLLVLALLVFAVLLIVAGRFLAGQALRPIGALARRAEDIGATNLDLRLPEGRGRDELAHMAATFNRMLDRLEKSFDGQKEFVSNVAHELRTPLAAIVGELELARERERSIPELQAAIDLALGDARRLSRLTTGLLDLAKAGYDRSEVAFHTLRPDEVLLEAMEDLQRMEPGHRVDIAFVNDPEEREPHITGNAYLLRTAFLNLMENACKYSDDHRCTVTLGTDAHELRIAFADHGRGIAAEDLPHLFKPFYRGGNGQRTAGHGIGLGLAQRIITLHRGTIEVESTVGEGSTFTVRLPV
jgi:signal transduction histidine kinase